MKPRLQLKQTVKVKVSVRARLMYAGAGIAITAVIGGIAFFLYGNLGTSEKAHASVSGDYRSVGTGLWSNAAVWEMYNGTAWEVAASVPNNTNGVITIQSGNTITVAANLTVDQLVIASGGEVDLNSSINLTVANGAGTDLDVSGTLKIAGTITTNTGGIIAFENGGKYQHNMDGGNILIAVWNTGSTCEITGVTNTKPEQLNQSFYNFTWNSDSQTSALDLGGALTIVNGDLNILSTGSSSIQFDEQGNNSLLTVSGNFNIQGGTTYACTNGSIEIHIAGNYLQNNGNFNFNKAGGNGYSSTSTVVNIYGNMTMTGGTIDLSQCDANNATIGNGQINLHGNLSLSGSALMTETSAHSRGQIYFNGASVQHFTSTNNVTQKIDFTVNSGAILSMDDQFISGDGNFSLLGSGGLMIGSANGITSSGASGNVQVTGTRSYSIYADYTYNGVLAQNSGNGLPSTVHNLTLNNSSGLTLTNTIAVSNHLTLTNGLITTGALEVNVTNSSTSAISDYSSSGYINGNLRRKIQTVGTFYYPVGTATQYEFASLALHSLAGVSDILVNFNTPNTGTAPDPGTCIVNGSAITTLLNYGFWNITPDATPAGGHFDLTLKERGYTNGGMSPNEYAIVTRPNTTSDWVSSGIHDANTQNEVNGTVTAVRSVLPVMGNFAIGLTTFATSIQQEDLKKGFNVYPNPTQGLITVSIPEITDQTMIRVFDIKGALVKETQPAKGSVTQIDLTGKLPGIYFVRVGNGGSTDASKQITLIR